MLDSEGFDAAGWVHDLLLEVSQLSKTTHAKKAAEAKKS